MILIVSTAVAATTASVLAAYGLSRRASGKALMSSLDGKIVELFPKTIPLLPAFEHYVTIRTESGIDPLPRKTVQQMRKFSTISANIASGYQEEAIIDEKKLLKMFEAYWKTFKALESGPDSSGNSAYHWTEILLADEAYYNAVQIQKRKMGEDFILLMCEMIDVTFYHRIKRYLDPKHNQRGQLEYFRDRFNEIVTTGLEEWKVLL